MLATDASLWTMTSMHIVALRLKPAKHTSAFFANAHMMLGNWDQTLKKSGTGRCFGHVEAEEAAAELHAKNSDQIDEFIDMLSRAFRDMGIDITLTVNRTVETPLTPEQQAEAELYCSEPVSLTRKFLNTLPTGSFICSVIGAPGRPAFAEEIGEPDSRAQLWELAKSAGVAQRNCYVFRNRTIAEQWNNSLVASLSRQGVP